MIYLAIFFTLGFIILVKGANFLVDGATLLARRLKVSDLVIALTVVAFGTSAPELFVNIFACLGGNTDIAVGNIIGSNIFNVLVILGISALIYPLSVTENTVWKEIPLSLFAALLLGIMVNDLLLDKAASSILSRSDGLILLSFFVVFMSYILEIAKHSRNTATPDTFVKNIWIKIIGFIVMGLVLLIIGSKLVVKSSVDLARLFGINESLIGLTIVAAGTSLPELATSAVAAFKKNADIAVGNIVGSNIFNIFFILGISALIRPVPFNAKSNFDILSLILVSLMLFLTAFTGRKKLIDRWEGVLFIISYGVYLTAIIIRG